MVAKGGGGDGRDWRVRYGMVRYGPQREPGNGTKPSERFRHAFAAAKTHRNDNFVPPGQLFGITVSSARLADTMGKEPPRQLAALLFSENIANEDDGHHHYGHGDIVLICL